VPGWSGVSLDGRKPMKTSTKAFLAGAAVVLVMLAIAIWGEP